MKPSRATPPPTHVLSARPSAQRTCAKLCFLYRSARLFSRSRTKARSRAVGKVTAAGWEAAGPSSVSHGHCKQLDAHGRPLERGQRCQVSSLSSWSWGRRWEVGCGMSGVDGLGGARWRWLDPAGPGDGWGGAALPRVSAQSAPQKSHGSSRQPRIAATQTDQPLAQAFLQVACPFTAHGVLRAQPARVGVRGLRSPSGGCAGAPGSLGSPSMDGGHRDLSTLRCMREHEI